MPDKKPKPSSNKIKRILGEAKDLAMSPIKATGQFALDRMAENLDPYNYGNKNFGGKSTLGRLYEAIGKNVKESDRAEAEQYIEKGYGLKPSSGFKERVDLLQMFANKKQKYGTVKPSKYRPTVGANQDEQYYDAPSLQSEIIKDLGLNEKEIRSSKDLLDIIIPRASINEKTGKPIIGKGGVTTTVPGLGQATYGTKRDSSGRLYLSYGDVWDLDPTQGASSEDKRVSLSGIRSLEDAKKYAIGLGSDIVATAATPTRVYGRIYFDEKTGKPILEDSGTKMPADRIKKVVSKKGNSK